MASSKVSKCHEECLYYAALEDRSRIRVWNQGENLSFREDIRAFTELSL